MNTHSQKIYDTIVVGAGISGLSAAYHLKKFSPQAEFLVLEGRDKFGDTWDFFKYPGTVYYTHLTMQTTPYV